MPVHLSDLNYSQIAEATGYSRPHISRVFNLKRRPSMRCFRAIRDYLKITTDQMWDLLNVPGSEEAEHVERLKRRKEAKPVDLSEWEE